MSCIFSCFSYDELPTPLPLGNTLLADPSISSSEHKWNALTYEFIHIVAIVAFVALTVGVLTWVIFFAAEYQTATLLASTVLFSVTYPTWIHPYRLTAQKYWHEEAFENEVIKQIGIINTEYNRLKADGPQYLENLHHKIGAAPLDSTIKNAITSTTQKVCAYETLIPLYARALAYDISAEKKLDIMKILILSPPRPASAQNQENLNYRELKQQLHDETLSEDQRLSIYKQLTLLMSEWYNLEKGYLVDRIKAAQVATIASNPIQNGERIGFINHFSDPASEALHLEFDNSSSPLFFFDKKGPSLTKQDLMKVHTDALDRVVQTAIYKLVISGEISLDGTGLALRMEEIVNKLAECNQAFLAHPASPQLNETEWTNIKQVVLNFISEFKNGTDPSAPINIKKVLEALQTPTVSRELLCVPSIRDIVQTRASHELRARLASHAST